MGRVVKQDDIESELSALRNAARIVFTNGCFDLLHVGHIRYLQEAKSLGNLLFVGLNSDASIKGLKGPERPIQDQSDRAEILAALDCVDFVCIFDEDTPAQLIEIVQPDVLVKGGDWPISKIVGADFVLGRGGEVKSLQFVKGKSTTGLVDKIIKL